MRARTKFLILLATLLVWLLALYLIGPDRITEAIGVENGYIIVTLIALFGGVSSFSGVTYIAALITFASAGLSPVGLAIASGIGVTFGDTLYFYLGKNGRSTVKKGRIHKLFKKVSLWLEDKPPFIVAIFTYAYSAFTPFPNDILAIGLGALHQRYVIVVPALVAGNITFTYILATFGTTLSF